MKNRICIWLPQKNISFKMPLSEIKLDDFCFLNQKEAHLLMVQYNWLAMCIEIYIYNPELPEVQSGFICPVYYLQDARLKFPYLFSDTNPILYRRFSSK